MKSKHILCWLLLSVNIVACSTKVVPPAKLTDETKEGAKKEDQHILRYIKAEELLKRIQAKENLILLDVRDEREYGDGHIEGAKLIPWNTLRTRHTELDPNKEIILYCYSGNRSQSANATLIFYGFKNTLQLNGGIMEWEQKKYPLVKGMTPYAQ